MSRDQQISIKSDDFYLLRKTGMFESLQGESREEKGAPDVGLEPTTVGLKVQRSTDWANRALRAATALYILYTRFL